MSIENTTFCDYGWPLLHYPKWNICGSHPFPRRAPFRGSHQTKLAARRKSLCHKLHTVSIHEQKGGKSSRKDSWCQDYSWLLRRARFEKVTVSPRKVALSKKGAKITFVWNSRGERLRSPDACKTPPFHLAAWLPHPSSKQPERGMFVLSVSTPPYSTLELYWDE